MGDLAIVLKGKSFSKLVIKFYLRFPVHDCKVSEWGPWSPCSVRCGAGGFTERHRVVLHQASNGGLACPHLVQAKPCRGSSCDEDEPEENWTGKKNYNAQFSRIFQDFFVTLQRGFSIHPLNPLRQEQPKATMDSMKRRMKSRFFILWFTLQFMKSPHIIYTQGIKNVNENSLC